MRQETRIDSRGTTTESTDELTGVQLESNPVRNDVQVCVQRLEIDVMPTISVRELTKSLAAMSGHEIENTELSYCGKVLHPDQTLKDCVGRSGKTLQLTRKSCSGEDGARKPGKSSLARTDPICNLKPQNRHMQMIHI